MRLPLLAGVLVAFAAVAGDDASGPIPFAVDLGQPFETHQLSEGDRAWSRALAARFKYSGSIVHFVRTTLPLEVDGKIIEGSVYHGVERPECFYVAKGDVMLQLGRPWAAGVGTGGISLHAPRSGNFLACLNCHCGGVPVLSSSPIRKGEVKWRGHLSTRALGVA